MCFFSSLVSRPSTKGKEKQYKTVKKKRNAVLMVTLDFKREDELDS